MSGWELRHGVWCLGPYRVMPRGARWMARKVRMRDHPQHIGTFESDRAGMAACIEQMRAVAER